MVFLSAAPVAHHSQPEVPIAFTTWIEMPAPHVYIHVPFCSGKCLYCGFYSEPYERDSAEAWLDALDCEIQIELAGARPAPQTVYIGGGTPSVLAPPLLRRLLNIVRAQFDIRPSTEWTLEANPGTLSDAHIGGLTSHGVNRVSLGAQSFDDSQLRTLRRRHNAAAAATTVAALRNAGITNINLDLIAALPGHGHTWSHTLETALTLDTPHLSVYCLTVESGTTLEACIHHGQFHLPDDEAQLAALDEAENRLHDRGFIRYEISNYAKPGYECGHNLAFWNGADYIGFGPAAGSRLGRLRRTNASDLGGYVRSLNSGMSPPRETETLSEATDAGERILFRLRTHRGICLEELPTDHRVSTCTLSTWRHQLTVMAAAGILEVDHTRYRLSRRGREVADAVIRELITSGS